MDWEGDVRSECLGVCRGKMWIKELSVQHKQFVNWFYYMNRPLHKCSLIEDHVKVDVFLGPDWLTWASQEKAFPGALVLLCWKKKKHCSLFVAKKEWKKKRRKREVNKAFTLYVISVCIFSILFSIHFLRCWQGEFG